MSKIEKLKKKHNDKIEILKILGEQKIEENKIKNEIALQDNTFESSQLTIKENIRLLKMNNSKDRNTIKSGKMLLLWGFIATLISSILTIAGLIRFFTDNYLKMITFIFVIVLSQLSVYILSKQITNIRLNFKQHYIKAEMLRVLLLIASISGNFTFFTSGRTNTIFSNIITLILCICIDLIAIYCSSIGEDFKRLNRQNTSIQHDFILIKQLLKSVQNRLIKKPVQIKTTDSKLLDNPVQIDNTDIKEIVKNTILENKNNNIAPSTKKLIEITQLKRLDVINAKKQLIEDGFLKTIGNTTYINDLEVIG
jgi:hypothetical protein